MRPAYVVGDFDSLTAAEFTRVKTAMGTVERHQPEKDDTDTQLALQHGLMVMHADEVFLYGATGGRLDHALANYWLPTERRFRPFIRRMHLIDRDNYVQYLDGGQPLTVLPRTGYRYVGVASLTAVRDLNITGAKYQLAHYDGDSPVSFASNEFVGAAPMTVQCARGVVAIIYSRDHHGQQVDN
ncbi:thiamine diphosphokinase [Lacticaseibacillus thailandensis]|nr:thiamine diphosphokinase [Lacticaseibacillus thailandensis]